MLLPYNLFSSLSTYAFRKNTFRKLRIHIYLLISQVLEYLWKNESVLKIILIKLLRFLVEDDRKANVE